jgi:hypothetical protein
MNSRQRYEPRRIRDGRSTPCEIIAGTLKEEMSYRSRSLATAPIPKQEIGERVQKGGVDERQAIHRVAIADGLTLRACSPAPRFGPLQAVAACIDDSLRQVISSIRSQATKILEGAKPVISVVVNFYGTPMAEMPGHEEGLLHAENRLVARRSSKTSLDKTIVSTSLRSVNRNRIRPIEFDDTDSSEWPSAPEPEE